MVFINRQNQGRIPPGLLLAPDSFLALYILPDFAVGGGSSTANSFWRLQMASPGFLRLPLYKATERTSSAKSTAKHGNTESRRTIYRMLDKDRFLHQLEQARRIVHKGGHKAVSLVHHRTASIEITSCRKPTTASQMTYAWRYRSL
jgi:hypothetical protein